MVGGLRSAARRAGLRGNSVTWTAVISREYEAHVVGGLRGAARRGGLRGNSVTWTAYLNKSRLDGDGGQFSACLPASVQMHF